MHRHIELVRFVCCGPNAESDFNVLSPALADISGLADIHSARTNFLNYINSGDFIGFQGFTKSLQRSLIPLSPNQLVDSVLPPNSRRKFSEY